MHRQKACSWRASQATISSLHSKPVSCILTRSRHVWLALFVGPLLHLGQVARVLGPHDPQQVDGPHHRLKLASQVAREGGGGSKFMASTVCTQRVKLINRLSTLRRPNALLICGTRDVSDNIRLMQNRVRKPNHYDISFIISSQRAADDKHAHAV